MFYVLLVLTDHEKHGYAIMKEITALPMENVRLESGTLYPTLKRLLARGMIVLCRRPRAAAQDHRRRYYRLTLFGRTALIAEARRMCDAVAVAQAKQLLRHNEPGKTR
jgi:DNA-binding PadR family transcriptional regulator